MKTFMDDLQAGDVVCDSVNCTGQVSSGTLFMNGLEAAPSSDPCSAQVTLGGAGTVTVNHVLVHATSKILLTGLAAHTGLLYVSAILDVTSFTITSSAGLADAGLVVSYLLIN